MKKTLLLFVLSLWWVVSYATHIIGGFINVSFTGGSQYEVVLRLYRDCNPGNAPFDQTAPIGIFDSSGNLVTTVTLNRISITSIPATSPNPCLVPPSNICVEEGLFSGTVTLNSSPGGYWLVYQRCCRNASILNIINPTSVGATYYAQIPDPGAYPGNSSPNFLSFPPVVICNYEPINYNHSAVDVDGDSLVYYLCAAMDGASPSNPAPNPPAAPPYNPVPYQSPYSATYPLASNPPLAINSNTGLLTGTPNLVGRFVVSICIDEYRNGVKIGHYRREFQFNTTTCSQNIQAHIVTSGPNNQVISCDDYTVNFQNSSVNGTYYYWDFGDPTTNADTSNLFEPTYTYPDTGTYTVMLIVNPGYICADTAYAQVVVYPTLAPGFSYTGTLCAGNTIQFTDTTVNSYGVITSRKYYFGDGDSSTLANPSHTYTSPGVYPVKLIVQTDLGCIDTVIQNLVINANPLLNPGNNQIICPGVGVTLNPVGSGNYSWVPAAGLSCTNCQSPTASPAATTTYTITLTSAQGCSTIDSVTVFVAAPPTVDAGPDVILCNTGVTQLNATATDTSGVQSISWSPSTGLSSTTILNPFANPLTTTTYTLTVTNNHGCVSVDSVTVYRNILSVNAGNNVSICFGDTTNLNAVSPNTVSYSWLPATGLSNPNIANPQAFPTITTMYTVTITDSANCSMVDSVQVTVNPLPNVDAGSNVQICVGNSTQLQATGASSYTWDANSSLSCTNCSNPTATPSVTTTYYVTGTDGNGCTARDSVTVTVATSPAITITPDTSVCIGGSVQLNVSGGVSYMWNPPATLSCAFCPSPVASPSSTTTYTVTVTDANNCSGTATVTVTVNPLPTISAGPDVSICAGSITTLNAIGGTSYQWSPATGLSCTNCASPVANPVATTQYTVVGTDANGCQNTDSVVVTVNALPTVTISPSTAICLGGSTNLSASGGVSYQWAPATGLSCTNCPNPNASPTTTTTYTVTVTDVNGCQNTATTTVTINPLPNITTGPDVAICSGSSTTLSASGGVSYVWTPGTGLSCTNCQNPVASPAITTTYTVTGTDANGCQNTATTTVTVNSLPTVSAGNDVSICAGGSTNLNAMGAVNYQWAPATGLSATNIANPVASPLVTTTFTVTGIDANGCQNTDMVTVTVNPLPVVNITQDTAICIGDAASLNVSGGTSYQWSPATGLSCTNCNSPVATPNTTITYFVLVTDANGCQNTDSVTVTINPLPNITSSADDTICVGEFSYLNASGGVSYVWSPVSGLSCVNCPSPTATPVSTTTYTVTGTDANGCSNTSTTTVTVNLLPNITITPNTGLCIGFSVPLLASGGGSYQWAPAAGLSCTNCPNPTATPTTTTTYTVTVTDANGCVNTDSVTVTVYTQIPITITPNSSICAGGSIQLNASGGTTYQWSPSTGLSATNIPNPVASPSVTTTYTVLVTDANGCSSTDSVTITVNSLPVITTGANDTICQNGSTILSVSGGVSYSWQPVASLSNPNIANPVATPSGTTIYTVTGTDANGCQNTATQTVVVNPLPNVDAGIDLAFCQGGSVQLNASGALFYQWAPATGLSATNIPDPVASPAATTVYTVTGTDANGCTNTDTVTVTVNPLPTVTVSPDMAICENGSTQLSASGGVSYKWSPATGLSNPNISNPVASPAASTTYTVTVVDANGCPNFDSVRVTVNALPVITTSPDDTICLGGSTVITASGGVSYVWSPPTGLSSTTVANPVASPTVTTTYMVTGTDANGCQANATVTVTVLNPADPMAGPDATICPGGSVQLNASNGVSYQWTPATDLSCTNCPDPVASPTSQTTYTVTIVDANGCTNTDQVTVSLFTPPVVSAGPDMTIYKGESVQLHGTGGVSYVWSPPTWLSDPNIADPVATPNDTITYILLVTDVNGCQNSDSMTIYVIGIPVAIVPTAFSPNGDGQNDVFRIGYRENFFLIRMQVFNRWGELVFETTDINQGWDGTYNGQPQPIGTYVFIIHGEDSKGYPIRKIGNVTLLR